MDQQEKDRMRRLMEEYLAGNNDPAAKERFDAWFNTYQPGNTPDLSKEEISEAMGRIGERLHHHVMPQKTGKRRRLHWAVPAAAAAAVLLIGIFAIWYRPVQHFTIATERGESKMVKLTDGSVVRLNENSSLTYTSRYETGPRREVMLEGEAFFEVTKNAAHPFIVNAGKAAITVLGTSFNVAVHRPDFSVIVAVRDGLISLRNKLQENGPAVLLAAGEAGELNNNSAPLHYAHSNVTNYMSWISGRIAFDGTSLKQVARELENIYHVPVKLQQREMETLHLTLQYRRAPLHDVLRVICQSLDLDYVEQQGVITIINARQ
ncbi:DUF4974 domain-containing protein [Chitinophaga agrisoli]|uniref:DUF4974 domain-containing protein n=1 Tax=Chitinophaga agrisoli TaxID=2607653 RepID=A0A5B2VNU4_9BACT|nr:FecR domain-containing protein [Chitinophaga agrisoli]KAA2239809.1 DUF4974 domain-containing protein [Chitinophaga agrisoli]